MKKWPLHNAFFWESAPFFRVLLPVVIGIICYAGMAFHFPIHYMLAVACVSFLLFSFTAKAKVTTVINALSFISFNAAVIAGMLSLCWFNDVHNQTNPIGTDTTGYAMVRITTPPLIKEKTSRYTVAAIATVKDQNTSTAAGNAYIYTFNSDVLSLTQGDTLLIPNHWQPITNPGNPFEYNYAAYCARNNLYYHQFLDASDISLYAHGSGKPGIIAQCHNWCMQQLQLNIPDAETCGLIQAMLLGDETNLDDNLKQAWAQTGIIHVIAISGGNITALFIIIAGLLWSLRHRKHLWIKYIIALPLIWLYVAIAGASPSAVRAAIMFSIVALSLVFQKNNNRLNTLFTAATLLLVAQPMWLYTAGFQLSFVAILSLILFYAPLYSLWSPSSRVLILLWQTVVGSIAVEILVAPLVVWYFYLFPLPFIIGNLLAFLFMNVVLVMGISILVFSCIPVVAKAIGWLVILFASSFNNIIDGLQHFNPTSFNYLHLTGWELVLVYLIIAGLTLFILRQKKPGLFLSIISCCILLLLLCCDEYTALHQQRFVAYNMGPVNHMEVITGKHNLVVNTDIHTLSAQKDYVLKPPHAMWHAWQKSDDSADDNIFLVNGRSVLILDHPVSTGIFPVDYLVVNMPPGKVHPALLFQVFHPRMLVFGSNYTTAQAAKWLAECNKLHTPAWHTGTQGAFIYGI